MQDKSKKIIRSLFYVLKPLIPRHFQIFMRRRIVAAQKRKFQNVWPVDKSAAMPPANWQGWPNGKKFALVLTHDVDTQKGHDRCLDLMELEKSIGFRSSFNFVPEKYRVSAELRDQLTQNGFEVGVHGLNHDGKLYQSKKMFEQRAESINQYLQEWGAVGFRSPAMHHNLEWLTQLNIEYDASTFDTDPFEPQSDGVGTIFPFRVTNKENGRSYFELPYTLVQDFTHFILMKRKDISIWTEKLDWIAKHGGMALLNVHPDYMNFGNGKLKIDEFTAEYYERFLTYVKNRYEGKYWHGLAKQLVVYLKNSLLS